MTHTDAQGPEILYLLQTLLLSQTFSTVFPCMFILFQLFPDIHSLPEWLCHISGCGSSLPSLSCTAASVFLQASTCKKEKSVIQPLAGMNICGHEPVPSRQPGNETPVPSVDGRPRCTRLRCHHTGCNRVGSSANKIPRGHFDVFCATHHGDQHTVLMTQPLFWSNTRLQTLLKKVHNG